MRKQQERAKASFGDFAKWALGNIPAPVFSIADKTYDTDRESAVGRGAVSNLYPPKAAVADPAANVGGTELQHRYNQKENP